MLTHVPIVFITAKSGKNVYRLLNLAQELSKQSMQRVTTGELNRVLRTAMETNPPPTAMNRTPKIYYASQVAVQPPTIVMFSNGPELFTETYMRYLLKQFREQLPFSEIPIKIEFRRRQGDQRDNSPDDTAIEEVALPKRPLKAAAPATPATPKVKPMPIKKKKSSKASELWDF